MSVRPRSKIIGVSAPAFVIALDSLIALRAWNLEPPIVMQSLTVDTGAVLVVVGVATHVTRGENIDTRASEGIVLALGPCLSLATNLFVSVSTVGSPLRVAYPLAAGVALILVVGKVGAVVGHVVRVVRKNGTAIGRTSQPAISPHPRVP